MADKYIFPAIFEPGEKGGYCVTFPDLPGCITEGDSLEEALYMAKDALELHLFGMEEEKEEIPLPTPPEKLNIQKGCFVVPITVYMIPVRDEMANKSINKTVTLPRWLNKAAEDAKINFSQLLQQAIKEKLGIKG